MGHHANGRFDWLISGHQSLNPSREAISILFGKCKRFTFVHPVQTVQNFSIKVSYEKDLKSVNTRSNLYICILIEPASSQEVLNGTWKLK